MLEVKINIGKLKGLLKSTQEQLLKATRDQGFLSATGSLMESRGKQNIAAGGPPTLSWPLLAASTQKQKKAKGFSLKPLSRTGYLAQSLGYEVKGVLALTSADYLKYHQSDEPRTRLPQRKVFTVEREDMADIRDFLLKRIQP